MQTSGFPFTKFQSTLPAGEATNLKLILTHDPLLFQSTLPAGEATPAASTCRTMSLFQSTLPAGEATQFKGADPKELAISIHASRGGSDLSANMHAQYPVDFNPRFPRGKRLGLEIRILVVIPYFNPRFPRGKRPNVSMMLPHFLLISIHASRGGSDSDEHRPHSF